MKLGIITLIGLIIVAAIGFYLKKSVFNKWDKTFSQSDKVRVEKVTFKNRYGIKLVGDLYIPKEKSSDKLAAIAISGPFGAVKPPAFTLKH